MFKNNPTQVMTNEVRLSYCYLTNPRATDDGKERYQTVILIPKTDTAKKAEIDQAIAAATEKAVTDKWNGKRPPQIKLSLHDGDGPRPNGDAYGAECKGHWVLSAASGQRPLLIGADGNPLEDTEVYSGMYARCLINFYGYDTSGSRGVACGLNGVQKLRDGDVLGGGMATVADFTDFGDTAPTIDPITGQPV